MIPDGVILSGLNVANPLFVLTCISTGGPAATVTWTRDSITVTEGIDTELDDSVTAQYTHTLGEDYTYTVENEVTTFRASDTLTVQGINCGNT